MTVRRTAAVALALSLVAAPVAARAARPPRVCGLVKDGTGDTYVARAQEMVGRSGPAEDGLDIVSADVASDGRTVTAVIRVRALAAAVATAPLGVGFTFEFGLPKSARSASMRALLPHGGEATYEVTFRDGGAMSNGPFVFGGTATGFLDTKRNEVHVSAPVAAFAGLGALRRGTVLVPSAASAATSGRLLPAPPADPTKPVPPRYLNADAAGTTTTYVVGTPSCVTPGR